MPKVDIREQNLKKPVEVVEYLLTRLHQIGIRSLHGLPGDYNLVALDYLEKAGINWVGNCNELNASYAADGYARVKGIGAILTTFGVGELSAINGIAGAYSEMVPLVHIVGCPSTISQKNGMLLHHTLGNGDFNVFANMSAMVSCEVARLNDPAQIAAQIDHALRECYIRSRPVYLMLPTDMVTRKVEGEHLDTPIDLDGPQNNQDKDKEDYVVDVVLKYLHAAKKPVVLVDACAIRHHVLPEVHAFIDKTKLPVFVTPMGKGAIDESHASYGGVYAGDASQPEIKDMIENSDLIVNIGSLKSDFNTAGFSVRMSQLNSIDLHSDHCVVRYSEYSGVRMRGVLRKVTDQVDVGQLQITTPPNAHHLDASGIKGDSPILQSWFWRYIAGFLRPNDIVVTETGTANFGIWDTRFPPGVTALNQVLWGSIGWAVGACQGAALGAKDAGENRRTVLFEGDGSLQLTVQEISTMIRHNLDVIIFVINNDGYTIERFIHGMDAGYNDIVMWKYQDLPAVFGANGNHTARKYEVRTKDQLDRLLADKEFTDGKGMRLVELFMPRDDAPRSLQLTAEASARNNARLE